MTGPEAIRSLAVHADDLVAAAEANARETRRVVLRVTPPYSGRMRARLHVVDDGGEDGTVHVEPETLLGDAVPPFPTPDVTEDELREATDDAYSVERHRTYHEERVREWREAVPTHVVDAVVIPAVGHEVSISILGP
ncbi:hypothetical protein ACFQGE_15070 [Halomicroarcula sp. GCM10025817]|uniref:hypothetical protein n=1 Tax=Haloarcula TaxID=2237 RepID=UPI0023E880C5|nr:hypothetical protein [Halomicroarcula sp. SYNS111]